MHTDLRVKYPLFLSDFRTK